MPKSQNPIIDGKKQCSCCKKLLTVECFSKDIHISNGLKSQCKQCDNKRRVASRKQPKIETAGEVVQELSIFKFEEKQVRTVMVNEEPYFVAKDVSEILGYSDTEKMTRRLDEDEKLTSQFGASGQVREMVIINESGLYSAIIGSNKLEAKKFKKWVTSEVLPSIRKNGGYLAPQVDFTNPDIMINLLNNWKADRDRLIEANKAIEVASKAIELQKPKVEFYDAVTGSDDTIDMAQASKVLNMGIGRNNLFELLRSRKILLDNNTPKQAYVDRGWFRLIESKFSKPDGTNCIYTKTVVFQKGLEAIRKIIIEAYQSQEYDDLFNT